MSSNNNAGRRGIISGLAVVALAGTVVFPSCGGGSSGGEGIGGTSGATGGSGGTTSTGSGGAKGAGASGGGGRTGTGGSASGGRGGSGSGAVIGSGGAGTAGAGRGGAAGFGNSGVTGGAGGTAGGTTGRGGAGGTATGAGGTAAVGAGGSGAGGATAGLSAGCSKAPTIASSNYNNGHHITITVGGMAREYILNVPTNYDNTHPYKFVIAYHELNGNDDEMYRNSYYHLLPLSNNTTIFVAPNGQQNGASCTQASGCGWPNPNDSDMLFADAVVSQIEQNFCVDTNRIFATGWSYGASMSEQTACERPLSGETHGWGVRAIAIYSVAYLSNTDNCKASSSKPVAYYASHGTNDTVLPYSGGVSIAQTWAAADGCTPQPPTQATGSHICTDFMGCSGGYPVEFCSFVGPHTPDPTDPGQNTSWEYQNVWTFLSQF
jgi:poly(3-hydroxybutyrate) depolymerase